MQTWSVQRCMEWRSLQIEEQARTDHREEPSSERFDDTVYCRGRIAAVIEEDTAHETNTAHYSVAHSPLRHCVSV